MNYYLIAKYNISRPGDGVVTDYSNFYDYISDIYPHET